MIMNDLEDVVALGGIIMFAARLFVSMTPTPKPDGFYGKFYRFIEVLGLEVGQSKDRGEEQIRPKE